MKDYKDITTLIKENFISEEEASTQNLIDKLKGVKDRGYLTKEQFLDICRWKSPRPEKWYSQNSEGKIIDISRKVFSTKYEKRKMDLLRSLSGVSIPVASAILTLPDPQNYGVIDIRVWQLLYKYGVVKKNPKGQNFTFANWYEYLTKLRYYAKKLEKSAREVERTLFWYHKNTQKGRLYG